ncbi:MAG: hypothetical protein A2520_01470 [Deltaproteobacteria bacterium RIFOXYD12_FULL_53_23]|nr:MAG: hypothetical protein A2520_01470 [Deltaproteobacteria bacterium RIFOXYD12_FULL_53_23]
MSYNNAIYLSGRVFRNIIYLILMFSLGGCANQYFRVDPVLSHPKMPVAANGTENNELKPLDFSTDPLYTDTNPDRNKRDKLQQKIITLSDAICEQHKGDIFGTAASFNLFTGIGSTALSAAATVVTGAAATNYAAGATVLNGAGTAVSSEVYQGMLKSSIIKAIAESREKKLNEILLKRDSKDISKYTMDDAVIDAQDYHFRCSFYHGIIVLSEDPKKRIASSREALISKIDILQSRLAETNKLSITQAEKDTTKTKILQGINALYDKLNATEQ